MVTILEFVTEALSAAWNSRYPQISRSWQSNWTNLTTFFAYPADIRKVIYTTNAIESLNSVIWHAIRKRKVFPTNESVKSGMAGNPGCVTELRDWRMAMSRFIIEFVYVRERLLPTPFAPACLLWRRLPHWPDDVFSVRLSTGQAL